MWFHRFAPVAGTQPTPSARGLLPEAWAERSFALHAPTLALGCVAILAGGDLLARTLGLAVIAAAVSLAHALRRVALRRPQAARAAPAH